MNKRPNPPGQESNKPVSKVSQKGLASPHNPQRPPKSPLRPVVASRQIQLAPKSPPKVGERGNSPIPFPYNTRGQGRNETSLKKAQDTTLKMGPHASKPYNEERVQPLAGSTFEKYNVNKPTSYSWRSELSMNDDGATNKVEGKRPNSGSSRPKTPPADHRGLTGLRNIGNTCFMNSILQCLSNTPPLQEYIMDDEFLLKIEYNSTMKGALVRSFANVIQELWRDNRVVDTSNFKDKVQQYAPRFMGYSQQDAQEFLRYLLEGLHEEVNRVKKTKRIHVEIDDSLTDNQKAAEAWKNYILYDNSIIVDLFVGQLKSTLMCTACSHSSVTFDPFWDLSMPIPSKSVQVGLSQCFDLFTREEILDGDEKPTCSKCQKRQKCTKSFLIQKYPKILVIHLKRFSPMERYRGKLTTVVDFPLIGFDLGPYTSKPNENVLYNLYGISNHSGSAYAGHYIATCKHPYTGEWHTYNDSRVSPISRQNIVTSDAYVLFYELAGRTRN